MSYFRFGFVLELVRKEAEAIGADQVMSTRLTIREIGSGLVELVAIGTAVRRAPPNMMPASETLIPQALILDGRRASVKTLVNPVAPMGVAKQGAGQAGQAVLGLVIMLVVLTSGCCLTGFAALFN